MPNGKPYIKSSTKKSGKGKWNARPSRNPGGKGKGKTMATIGQLVINVGMNVADMIGASEKAEKSFSNMVKRMEKDAKIMRKELNHLGEEFLSMGKYAAVGAVIGLAAVVKHSFETADALGKTSDALGISTEKLTQLQYAAALAGVNSEAFTGSMFTMTKNVADASMGLGKAQVAFAAMGINVQKLVTMAPDKQFELIANKIAAIENPAIKAQMAMKIFGDSGAAMLAVMKDGAGGLKDAAEQADALGLSISRVDAAKIEQANDAMTSAGGVFKGVGNTIAIMLAPAIEGLSKDFIKMATNSEWWKDGIKAAFDAMITGAGWAANGIRGIGLVLLVIEEGFQSLKVLGLGVLLALGDGFFGFVEFFGTSFSKVLDFVSSSMISLGKGMQDTGIPAIKELGIGLEAVGDAGKAAAAATMELTDGAESSQQAIKLMLNDSIASLADMQLRRAVWVKNMETPFDFHKSMAAYTALSQAEAGLVKQSIDNAKTAAEAKHIIWVKNLQEKMKAHFEHEKKIDEEALKYIAKSIVDTSSGQEKLRAEYDVTMKQFSGGTVTQLEAQKTAWRVYNAKLIEMNGKVAAEMRDKNYEALKAMVKNTEDMSNEAVDKRRAAMAEMEKRDNEWGQNFKDKFEEGLGAAKSFYDQVGILGAKWGEATKNTFKDVFEDGLNGNLKNSGDYIEAFKRAVVAAIATMAAEWVTAHIIMTAASEVFFIAQVVGWTAVGIAMTAALFIIVAAWVLIKAILDNWNGIMTTLQDAWDGLAKTINDVGQIFTSIGQSIVKAFEPVQTLLNDIWKIFQDIADLGKNAFSFKIEWPDWQGKGTVETLLGIDIPFLSFADGGNIPGMWNGQKGLRGDTVPAILTPGEYVIPRDKVNPETRATIEYIHKTGRVPVPFWDLGGVSDFVSNITNGAVTLSGSGDTIDFVNSLFSDPWAYVKKMVMDGMKGIMEHMGLASGFVNGGIMTAQGALPLNAYADGGIADRPQVALFGEGRMNEAYVPLPDGKSIPVTMKGNQQGGGDVILMLDGQVLGRILNAMSQQGRLSINPIAVRSGYAI